MVFTICLLKLKAICIQSDLNIVSLKDIHIADITLDEYKKQKIQLDLFGLVHSVLGCVEHLLHLKYYGTAIKYSL